MTALAGVLCGFLVAMVVCEAVLQRQKVQFAAVTLVLIHLIACLLTILFVLRRGDVSPVPILLFWGGALLAWLGVRTHIESSILLRMLAIMKRSGGMMTRSALSTVYDQRHGVEKRLRELEEAAYIIRKPDRIEVREKGRRAQKIYNLVTFFWRG